METITSAADVPEFVNRETVRVDIEKLRKCELWIIAEHFELGISRSVVKKDLLNQIKQYLQIDRTEVEEDVTEGMNVNVEGASVNVVNEGNGGNVDESGGRPSGENQGNVDESERTHDGNHEGVDERGRENVDESRNDADESERVQEEESVESEVGSEDERELTETQIIRLQFKMRQMELKKARIDVERERQKVAREKHIASENERERKREKAQREHEMNLAVLAAEREEKERKHAAEEKEKERKYEEKEKIRLMEEKERDRKEREEERKHELEKLRIQPVGGASGSPRQFDVTKYVKMLPKFSETEVSKFFVSFEKVAEQLNWPREQWAILVQVVLIGKAQLAYSALSGEDSADYDKVKSAVLRTYELVPEAYRQKFRDLRKTNDQTYMEFARHKERLFNEWCNSKKIEGIDQLRQLVLLEEFKRCIPNDLKTHLEEVKAETLDIAAKTSDEYILTHKQFSKNPQRNFPSPVQNKLPVRKKEDNVGRSDRPNIRCFYCGKLGHIRDNCYAWKNRTPVKNNMLIVNLTNCRGEPKSEREIWGSFKWFISEGNVSCPDYSSGGRKVKVLRDTGGEQSMLLESCLPQGTEVSKNGVYIKGYPDGGAWCPYAYVNLDTNCVKGNLKIAVTKTLPIKGVDLVLCNDLAQDKSVITSEEEVERLRKEFEPETELSDIGTYSSRDWLPEGNINVKPSKLKVESDDVNTSSLFVEEKGKINVKTNKPKVELDDVKVCSLINVGEGSNDIEPSEHKVILEQDLTREALIREQKTDPEINELRRYCEEGSKQKDRYFLYNDLLMRKFTPIAGGVGDQWKSSRQIVVPFKLRRNLLERAHENLFAGHAGAGKTFKKLSRNFFWPGCKRDVFKFCKTCHVCQVMGKPNQLIPKAPLIPIPSIGEPFEHILIDIVGPLPTSTSGVIYLLTIMDRASRYPEAIPLKSITSKVIVTKLIDFFSRYGLPKTIQSDNGTNFTSNYFKEQMKELGIKQVFSTPYHPESQGAIERFHQTLKSMLKKYCMDQGNVWARKLPFVLFAIRSAPNDSLGLSPFELIFGHQVRGPLEIVRDHWEEDSPTENIIDWLSKSKGQLFDAWEFAKENLIKSQEDMKKKFDVKTKSREFKEGEKVLALLPVPGNPFQAKFFGPYDVVRKINEVNYVINTPERRKEQFHCHINMLKPYYEREVKSVMLINREFNVGNVESPVELSEAAWPKTNSEIANNLEDKLAHLKLDQMKEDMKKVIMSCPSVIRDSPGRTNLVSHDVDVKDAKPVKQHPYRLNPRKSKIVQDEVKYMLDHNLIKPSHSPWSSPVVLVPKDKDQFRLCFDYRKVNQVTETDAYPLPRIEDCVDRIGNAKFITKIDLMKGFWQVPLTKRAKAISAFVTPQGLYECEVMPFGMKNAALTFQKMMHMITADLPNCVVYIDDVIIFNDTWEDHINQVLMFFKALEKANLVINLDKSDFGYAKVKYLGHEVGYGKVSPKTSNIQAILEFPVPKTRKNILQFLGVAGYYRKFVPNFSDIACPLTNLLKKNVKFNWDENCEEAFKKLKSILVTCPILKSPDFGSPFFLSVDASDTGVGAVLEQSDKDGERHPIAYYSKKLNESQRKYSTIEKETLALILALAHFEIYVSSNMGSLVVYTDHNPLRFLNKFKNKNQRLTRWSLLLQGWNLEIKHVKGAENKIPDALSRM